MEIHEALERHTDALLGIPGVVGVGETEVDGRPAVMVMVVRDTDEIRAALPAEVGGFPVVIDETGEISALPAE